MKQAPGSFFENAIWPTQHIANYENYAVFIDDLDTVYLYDMVEEFGLPPVEVFDLWGMAADPIS